MIRFVNVSKTFGPHDNPIYALKNVNLTVNDGDIFGIIGKSGAGKSTLLRCVNMLEKPTLGSVFIGDDDVTKVGAKKLALIRKNVGMIFQNFNLLAQRTVEDNVKLPLEFNKTNKAEAKKRVDCLLSLVGLSDKAKNYPSELSGGQKQRTAIARALATNPEYLLCDEATSALDPEATENVLSLLKKINKTLGVTILLITHEMNVIESVCNKVAVIENGEIAECGNVTDVFSAPKSDEAKRIILPKLNGSLKYEPNAAKFKLIFDGTSSAEPIVARIAVDCGVLCNVIYADTKIIDGKPFGQTVITMPNDEKTICAVYDYLKNCGVKFVKE